MTLLLLPVPGNEAMTAALAAALDQNAPGSAEIGRCTVRAFPDGEHYVRIETPVRGREVAIVCTLHRPDDVALALLLLAATARDLGAVRVGLVAPYLAYMRQDRRFADGEGVTSAYFATIVSASVDWLVTVDPHLHRYASLAEIYTIDTVVAHAAPAIAAWIRTNVTRPVVIGPDGESAQWARAIADDAGAPSLVLVKERRGDRDVDVHVPDVHRWRDHTPVLVDDIVSTARTMIAAAGHLAESGLARPVCVGVHAVFAAGAADELAHAAARVVTCDTIPHPTNAIAVAPLLAATLPRPPRL